MRKGPEKEEQSSPQMTVTPRPLWEGPLTVPPKCASGKMNTQVPDAEAAKESQLLATARWPTSGSPNFILLPRGLCQSHPEGSHQAGSGRQGHLPRRRRADSRSRRDIASICPSPAPKAPERTPSWIKPLTVSHG